jgi:hypothetical protein
MRKIVFVAFGILLLALDGAFMHVLGVEWIRPDPVLILSVYLALNMRTGEGAVVVFLLGAAAGSFAGTPPGMMISAHFLVWLAACWARRFVISNRLASHLAVLFAMSLLLSLLLFVYLFAMDIHAQVLWINFKAALPLALIHLLLAPPIWAVSGKIWPRYDSREFEMASPF